MYFIIIITPYLVKFEPNETKTIKVTAQFSCTTNLSNAFLCCYIKEKDIRNSLCSLLAQTELSSLISVDDLTIIKELGQGAYDCFLFFLF